MSGRTKIEWCDATWNPVTGCTPVSPACDHCYARMAAMRLSHIKGSGYEGLCWLMQWLWSVLP